MLNYFIATFVALIILLILKKANLKNWNYWKKRGIKTIPASFFSSFFSRRPFPELERELYFEKMKCHKFAGVDDIIVGPGVYIKDIEVIKRIMIKDFEHFPNRGFSSDETGDYGALMLTNQFGNKWKSLRNTLSPIFTTGKIKRLFQAFDECASHLDKFILETISKPGNEEKRVVEVQNVLQRYAMSVIARVVFAVDSQAFASIDKEPIFLKMAKRLSAFNFILLIKFIIMLISPKLIKLLKIQVFDTQSSEYFGNIIMDAIKNRKNLGKDVKFNDFLELMLETRKTKQNEEEVENLDNFEKDAQLNVKTKMELDDKNITAQCILFFFAGFDTTETTLTWAVYELALNQDIQTKLRTEVEKAINNSKNGKLDYESLSEIDYLDKIINETLRKYPPAVRTDRQCAKEYYIEEFDITIEKDMVVHLPILGFHHDPEFFPNPEKFDPHRFDNEEKEKRHPYAFTPFGQGPRNCIGMRFALQETKTLLAHLVTNFYIEPCEETVIPAKLTNKSFFLKPDNGMKLSFKKRN